MKYIEDNIPTKLIDLGLREAFVNLTPKVRKEKAKVKEWDYTKLKSFWAGKETINKTKRPPTNWKKIFANNISDKELISKI